MNKQTAVEWLQEQFRAFGTITDSDDERTHQLIKTAINMCEQAKSMEREQIIDAVSKGFDNCEEGKVRWLGEHYYNITYKGGEQ